MSNVLVGVHRVEAHELDAVNVASFVVENSNPLLGDEFQGGFGIDARFTIAGDEVGGCLETGGQGSTRINVELSPCGALVLVLVTR